MKRIYFTTMVVVLFSIFLIMCSKSIVIAQTVIYNENMGTPTTTTVVTSYTGWSQTGVTYYGNTDVRNTSPSSGYQGASGGGNVFFTNSVGRYFMIAGINTQNYTSLTLSFGLYKSTTSENGSNFLVEVSSDSSQWNTLSFGPLPTGTGTATWHWVNTSGAIPSANKIWIRFTNNSSSVQFRIDDIIITGIPASADQNSIAQAPTVQVSSGTISSLATSPQTAVLCFKIALRDLGTSDGLPTIITNIRLKPGNNNTADWTDNIQGIVLRRGGLVGTEVTTGSQIITDNYIDIPIPSGNFTLNDGETDTASFWVYLNTSNISDNKIISFKIDANNHGFTSHPSGSGFASSFGTDINSNDFTISVVANHLGFITQPSNTVVDDIMFPPVVAGFLDNNGNIDLAYVGKTIRLTSSGSLNNSPIDVIINSEGKAIFNNLVHSAPGNNLFLTIQDLDAGSGFQNAVSNYFNITAAPLAPSITDIYVPLYMQGINGTNSQRTTIAYRLKIENLQPNKTYRFFNLLDTLNSTSNGAGVVILTNATGNFTYISTPSMTSAYGTFTTDNNGSYTGWFMNEPTGNERFTPGNVLYPKIMLNDGNNGTTVVTRLMANSGITVINYGTSISNGSGIWSKSSGTPKNFVLLYDNVEGTGRPIAINVIEKDGLTSSTSTVSYYRNMVDTTDGGWGVIIPNNLPQGIRRIEQRSISDGSLVGCAMSSNGIWNGVNTVNPTNGTNPLYIDNATAPLNVCLMLPPQLIADNTDNNVDNNIEITFTDDVNWRNAITAVKINNNLLTPSTDYTISSGVLTLKPSGGNPLLTTAGNKTVTIQANGYSDAIVNQEILHGQISLTTSSVTCIPQLYPNTTSTLTFIAKDQYHNPIPNYIAKLTITIVNNVSNQNEIYVINSQNYISSASNIALPSTNNNGISTSTITLPLMIDENDGISIQVYLNDGTTPIGNTFSYFAPTIPMLYAIASNLAENNLDGNVINLVLANEQFIDTIVNLTNIILNNAPIGLSVNNIVFSSTSYATIYLQFNNTDFDTDVNNFSITIDGSELVSGNSITSNNLTITAIVETLPVVVTNSSATYIGETTAIWGGNVLSDGGAPIIQKGICWSINPNPTISDNKTMEGPGIGIITGEMTGLSGNTTYYVRAYATNMEGTAYGNQYQFTTLQPDLTPPVAIKAWAENFTTVYVVFSEPVDTSAENVLYYSGLGTISSAVRTQTLDTVKLTLATPLTSGVSYTLTVHAGIKDNSSNHNPMTEDKTFIIKYGPQLNVNIVITEIMYNDAGVGTDYLEFIEFYNNGNQTVNLKDFYMSAGVVYTFPDYNMAPGTYFVICYDSVKFANVFGLSARKWTSGNLANTGEAIVLKDNYHNTIDSVYYRPVAPWPVEGAGQGPSITLCNPNDDNNNGANWRASTEYVTTWAGVPLYASPFAGCASGDIYPPIVLTAFATDYDKVTVVFNEPVNNTAENVNNYSGLGQITSAVRSNSLDSVFLTLATPLSPGIPDTLFINYIADTSGNIMTNAQSFVIVYGTQPDTIPPQVLSIEAISLNKIRVVYSEPVNDTLGSIYSATNPINYRFSVGSNLSISNITADVTKTIFTINLSTPLISGVPDSLCVSGPIGDLSNNYMTSEFCEKIIYNLPIQRDTIIYYSFPISSPLPSAGLTVNLNNPISRESSYSGTYSYLSGASGSPGDTAISTASWNNGMGTKYWVIKFSTINYKDLQLSSKQRSSSTGPRDFIVEYSIDGINWQQVPNSVITCTTTFSSGVLSAIPLPVGCENQNEVYLRWIMSSNTAVNNSPVVGSGTSRIDDILVTGIYDPLLEIEGYHSNNIAMIYPNPSHGIFYVHTNEKSLKMTIFDLTGKILCKEILTSGVNVVNHNLPAGFYFIKIENNNISQIFKLLAK